MDPAPNLEHSFYYLVNAGHSNLLEVSGSSVHGWSDGQAVEAILQDFSLNSVSSVSMKWMVKPCARSGESQVSFTIVNLTNGTAKYLQARGTTVVANQYLGSLNEIPNELRWRFIVCPHDTSCHYLVNLAANMFLDSHGSTITVWNNDGKDIDTVISQNTSIYAKNLRWFLVPSQARVEEKNDRQKVRILHLSDTHNMQRTIEQSFALPEADILLHTGDFTNRGTNEELTLFNDWLGTLKSRYPHIIIVSGNHDMWSGHTSSSMRSIITNAVLLDRDEIRIYGIRIFGISWQNGAPDGNPDNVVGASDVLGRLPQNVDILMTHCPPRGILDMVSEEYGWGSSEMLRSEIERKKPKVHLFGHLHEQRGVWYKEQGKWTGGVEFVPWPFPNVPPSLNYPGQLISCNAMSNHNSWDKKGNCIAGPARLIYATKVDGEWDFSIK